MKKEGESAKLAAIHELPEKVDHDRHAALVEKLSGDVGEFRVRIEDDELVQQAPVNMVGQAANVQIEGTTSRSCRS